MSALLLAGAPLQAGDRPSAAPVQRTPPTQAAPASPDPADDIVVVGRDRRGDPLAPVNEQSFAVTQAVDQAIVGPLARAYKRNVPGTIRSGLRNFLANLREPVVMLNYLLQLKPGKAGETLGRFAINTTVGAAGLVDVAKKRPFNLPRRRNGLANTFGYYGIKPGPFLFLPLIGPVSLRDLVGNVLDQVMVPVTAVPPLDRQIVTVPLLNLGALDYRAEYDEELEKLRAGRDPYAAVRRYYLARRQAEIDALRGRAPAIPPGGAYFLPPVEALGAGTPSAPAPTATPVPPSEPRTIVIPPPPPPAPPPAPAGEAVS
ncbi:MAG TPA: VacJ family lipoprotein [Sphingomonas sp.]|uniref:MlaA family lipoprotein n=1 Tax=Sphingomonas sp. TaxID=28214 RepID=UPI002ED9D16E